MNTPEKPRLINPALAWFMFSMVLANISSRMIFPLLPIYIAEELGASIPEIGLTFMLANILPLVLSIFGGWLSDTIGRLRTIALGASIATFGYLGLVIAPTWGWISVALMIEYISGSLVGPSFGAFIADQSTEENRGKVFGIVDTVFMLVSVIGPPLGGFLAYRYSFSTMMTVAASIYIAAAVLRIWMATSPRFTANTDPEDSNTEQLTLANFKSNLLKMLGLFTAGGVLTWILVTDGVRDVALMLTDDLEPLYLADIGGLNVAQIGLLGSIHGIVKMLIATPGGWLSDKFGEYVPITMGFLLQFVAFMAFIRVDSLLGFGWTWAVFGVGVGIMSPAYNSLISKVVPENMRGLAYGLFWTSISILALPSPYLGALLWENFTPQTPFAITGYVVLISAIPAWFKFKQPKTELSAEPTPGD